MNPLRLDSKNRKFYEALLELNATDADDPNWLEKYRKVKLTRKTEGMAIYKGWKCFWELKERPYSADFGRNFL